MHINDFLKLDLKTNDYIWIMNEKGEGFWGNYNGGYDATKQTFQFRNHSNGKTQTIEIMKLQRLELNQRA
jgi:hypothetical protein